MTLTVGSLFSGIGGFDLGLERAGMRVIWQSEIDPYASAVLRKHWPEVPNHGDIRSIRAGTAERPDLICGGFPCQPFSIAGVSKKNALGRPHGFECTTQGTLFFDVARIIAEKKPTAFLLENVKNLISHDKKNTFRVILETLRDELGYEVHWKIIDGQSWVPQHRERIIIVGFKEKTDFTWDALKLPEKGPVLGSILHREDGSEEVPEHDVGRYLDGKGKVLRKYTLTDNLWAYLQQYAEKHRAKGNGFGFGLVGPGDVTRTLSARYYKDGSEILVSRGKKNPRRLTPRECARLMGYPETFKIVVSDTQAYKQFGNSVVVPVMREVARIMKPHVLALKAGASRKGLVTS